MKLDAQVKSVFCLFIFFTATTEMSKIVLGAKDIHPEEAATFLAGFMYPRQKNTSFSFGQWGKGSASGGFVVFYQK